MNNDKKAARIQVAAEQARITEETRVRLQHEREQLRLQRERQKLILAEEKKQTRDAAKQRRRIRRQQARAKLARRIQALMPTIGRRVMIAGPILAPMAVAWIGQIGFATHTLKWPLAGGLVFAAAWELTTAFAGWMYHEARKAGDRGALFRFATWLFASSAGAMNYWHALDGASIYHPTPKAVSYGTMSLVGIGLWELYSSLIHRKHLRATGKMPAPRPRFGILLWIRFTRITWHAWSLSVRHGIRTVDAAWAEAVAEVERIDRIKAAKKARRKLAKDDRPSVRVSVVRIVDHTVAPKPAIRVYRVDSLGATFDRPVVAPDGGPRAVEGHNEDGANIGANGGRPQKPAPVVAPQPVAPPVVAPPAPNHLVATRSGPANGNQVAPPAKDTTVVEFAPRGETQATMRAHWDTVIADGRIPSGADLNRAASKDPKYSLGKKYARQWRQELPEAFVEAAQAGRTEEARKLAADFTGAERKAVAR